MSCHLGLVAQSVIVDLVGSLALRSVKRTFGVVEPHEFGGRVSEVAPAGSGVQVEVLVLDGPPQGIIS